MELKSYDNVDKFIQEGSCGSNFITICASNKTFFEAMECNKILTMSNWIVLDQGYWGSSYHKYNVSSYSVNQLTGLKRLQYRKIFHSDAIVVVTDDTFYIDSGVKEEIDFARYLQLPIILYNGVYFKALDSNNLFSCKRHDIQITEDIINEFEGRIKTNRDHL